MVQIHGSAEKAHGRRLFAARGHTFPSPEAVPSPGQSWLGGLSAPPRFARWASSFGDVRSCWDACADPEWLLWLAARTSDPGKQREQVVLCAAELAGLAQRGGRGADPRTARAISMAQACTGPQANVPDLLAAESEALSAARESALAAGREAERALATFRMAPRRRLSSPGMNQALGASLRWHAEERDGWLALAAASAAHAAAHAADPAVPAAEWASGVSQSAAFVLRAMPPRGPAGGRQESTARRRCARLVKRRLPCP